LVGSLGAEVEESRSTRLDFGVLLLPDDPPRERERDPEERLLDFADEAPELLERLLLLDRELRWAILAFPVERLPGDASYLCFFRAFSAASATSPTCWPIFPTRCAAEVSESRSILLRSIDGALIFFSGLRDLWFWLRIARPPAMPARTAPAATSGVLAFEAICATPLPALLTALVPLFAAPRPVDFARDRVLDALEPFRCF
jgi:hypothetical protein